MEELGRRQVRYWLFRFRTQAEGGSKANDAPPGLRETFEEHRGSKTKREFWLAFAVSWDVGENNPLEMVSRKFSVWEEWNAILRQSVKTLPGYEHLDEVGK